jgi:hypothetical protein
MIKFVPEFIKTMGNEIKNVFQSVIEWVKDALRKVTGGGIIDSVKESVSSLPGIGRTLVDISTGGLSAVGRKLGFAQGGMIPPGFNNDNFPARLTSGELVIDRSLTNRLANFLDKKESVNEGTGVSESLLAQILEKLSEPQTVQTQVSVNESTFADIMLELNRNNARVEQV